MSARRTTSAASGRLYIEGYTEHCSLEAEHMPESASRLNVLRRGLACMPSPNLIGFDCSISLLGECLVEARKVRITNSCQSYLSSSTGISLESCQSGRVLVRER